MLKFENSTNGRFFYLSIERDMLNERVLTIIRGGVNSRVIRRVVFGCELAIQKEVSRLTVKRLKRGYHLVDADQR